MAQQNDTCRELQQSIESCALELAYVKASHQVELTCRSEQARQLRIQILFLEDERDELQAHLAQDDDRIDHLEKHNKDLQEDLCARKTSLDVASDSLRLKGREVETLKAELNSLHGVTMDSTKLLTEKLTLARELSCLRPEIDHLRSQVASHQSLLAEKLSLQRQVSSLQAELETEKRSVQRAQAKEERMHAADTHFESRCETLQADLLRERRDRQKVDREAKQKSVELEKKTATLESRLDAFRTKLKTTKEQLKEAQLKLETAQASGNAVSGRANRATNSSTSLAKTSRKRGAAQMDADTMIGTPGDLPVGKKNKRGSFVVGEKSTFSITPFLNRTASVAPESPQIENVGSDDETSSKPAYVSSKRINPKHLSKPISRNLDLTKGAGRAKSSGVLENATLSKTNARVPTGRKPKAVPLLDQVAEEANSENDNGIVPAPTTSAGIPPLDESNNPDPDTKKKKRKLLGAGLGKTIFDDDEGHAVKGDGGLTGGVKGFKPLARGGLGGPVVGPRITHNADMSAFGEISPRKSR